MWRSIARSDWDTRTAGHLLARAGFGPDLAEIEAAAARPPEEVVEELLDFDGSAALGDGPPWTRSPDAALRPASKLGVKSCMDPRVKAMVHAEHELVDQLRIWWLRRMRYTERPLQEKLMLFWHGHWTTSASKVFSSYALWLQHRTLRRFAAGNFEQMVRELSRDPAMMFYLDIHLNRAEAPNENFARELMELFTLGIGHYTEDDVANCARAFTGWKADKERIGFNECPDRHDDGEKVFLGREGRFTPSDIIDILFEHPAMGLHIARKLCVFFAFEDPEPALVDDLATVFREGGFELRPLLERMFLNEAFYSPRAIQTQIKSPVQWLVGTTRMLGAPLPDEGVCLWMLELLGQVLFEPPSVEGWKGGRDWITAQSLLSRYNCAGLLLEGGELLRSTFSDELPERAEARATTDEDGVRPALMRMNPLLGGERLLPTEQRASREAAVSFLGRLLFGCAPPAAYHAALLESVARLPEPASWTDDDVRTLAHTLMSTPLFQLT